MSKRRGLSGSKKIRPVVPPLQKEDEEPQTHFLISGLGAMDSAPPAVPQSRNSRLMEIQSPPQAITFHVND
jgi:hypothetical protein